jgi:hypothetical protein
MGAAQSSPEPSAPSCPQPVYDSTTCKEFVGAGCPQPVYDSTTCKEFVGTGCPKPVYDSTTCKAFVGTGCPKPVYDSTTCKAFVGTGSPKPTETIKKSLELIKTEKKSFSKGGNFSFDVTMDKVKVDTVKINKLIFDFTKLKKPNSNIVFEIKVDDVSVYKIEVKARDKIINELPVIFDVKGKKLYAYLNCVIDPSESETDFGEISIDSEMVLVNQDATAVKSTFGAMSDYSISKFGSMGSTFLIILIILLIVGGVLYFLHKKGKIKIPGLPQRIAAFGRQIKAIRKM